MPDADLLGCLAYASLTAFGRTAAAADLAPTLTAKATMARLAVTDYQNYESLVAALAERRIEAEEAMAPFIPPIDAFHSRTRSQDWLENLLAAYAGAGMAADLAAEVTTIGGTGLPDLAHDGEFADFAAEQLRSAVSAEPARAGRLALWSRRLLGEALSQAQRVAADRIDLTAALGGDLTQFGALLLRLTERHTARIAALGLG